MRSHLNRGSDWPVLNFSPDEFKSRKRKQAKTMIAREDYDQVEEMSGVGGSDEVNDGCSKRRETLEGRLQSNPTSQFYLDWKENILRQARERVLESEL